MTILIKNNSKSDKESKSWVCWAEFPKITGIPQKQLFLTKNPTSGYLDTTGYGMYIDVQGSNYTT